MRNGELAALGIVLLLLGGCSSGDTEVADAPAPTVRFENAADTDTDERLAAVEQRLEEAEAQVSDLEDSLAEHDAALEAIVGAIEEIDVDTAASDLENLKICVNRNFDDVQSVFGGISDPDYVSFRNCF